MVRENRIKVESITLTSDANEVGTGYTSRNLNGEVVAISTSGTAASYDLTVWASGQSWSNNHRILFVQATGANIFYPARIKSDYDGTAIVNTANQYASPMIKDYAYASGTSLGADGSTLKVDVYYR